MRSRASGPGRTWGAVRRSGRLVDGAEHGPFPGPGRPGGRRGLPEHGPLALHDSLESGCRLVQLSDAHQQGAQLAGHIENNTVVSAALTGAGLGILFTTLFAAHGLYGFIGSVPALLVVIGHLGAED